MTIEADPGHPRLREALAALPERREPARDLWPDIAARLPARAAPASRPMPARMRRWPWLFAAAASLAVVLLVPALLRPPVPTGQSAAMADDPALLLLDAYATVLAAETAAGASDAVLMPAGHAGIRGAVRELDQATAALAAALRSEPDSQLLRRLLHQTLQQRAALARQALDA
ncbi:MAG: hypothetical protein U0S76_07525 [Pseudoxanthomonas sp.]|nr:hypothetical protein [Pseudoxanthomonas sp.]